MGRDSRNKRKDGLKTRDKEWVLLSPYMGTFGGEIDDKSWLVQAGRALREHRGQGFTNFSFSSNRTLCLNALLSGTTVDETERGGAALLEVGVAALNHCLLPFLPCSHHHAFLEP